jgi:hypothetical protein
MCNSLEDFAKGGPFKIIEINGAGSEPTHIYDPQHSIFFAWKEIVLHWYWLWRISKLQHQAGIPYLTWKEGWEMLKANKALEARLRQF